MFLKNFNYYLRNKFFYNDKTTPLDSGELLSYDGLDMSLFNKSNDTYGNPFGFDFQDLDYTVTKIGGMDALSTMNSASNLVGGGGYSYISNSYYSGCQTIFGTGNVSPTTDDYRLSGDVIRGLSPTNVTLTSVFERVNGVNKLITTYTISNTLGKDITIGEIGIMTTIRAYYYLYSQNKNGYDIYIPILLERTALDEPITIPADGIGKVTYTLEMEDAIVSAT